MFKRELLDNGMRVVTERISNVRSVSLGVWIDIGSRDESPELSGVSHFIEHMLFKGTKRRSARDIAIEMDSMGGELNAFTSKEGTTYYFKVLDEHLPRALDLLTDVFNNSTFEPKELDRERKVIMEEIKMVEDTPDDLVHELLYESVWKGTPLGQPVLGTRRSMSGLDREDLVGYMKKFYTPHNIVISAAGNFDHDMLMETLNKSFGGRKQGKDRENAGPAGFKVSVNVRNRKLEQAHICIGVRGLPYSHVDRFGMYALNTLLGSSMSSRLFQEIRERRGLAYSVYSYLTSLKDTGLFVIYAGVSPSKAASVVRLVWKEIDKLLDSGVKKDELEKVKEQLKGNMVLAMENTYNRMSQLAKHEMYLGRRYTLNEIISEIEKVNPEQVHRLVSELFGSREIAMSALGPVDKDELQKEIPVH